MQCSYTEARRSIKTGDIVFMRRTNTLFSRVVAWATGSVYTHVGIAVWMRTDVGSQRLFIIEAHNSAGRRIALLSHYRLRDMDVIPMPKQVDWMDAEMALMGRVGRVRYGWFDLFQIWAWERLGLRLGDSSGEVCSEMVADVLRNSHLWMPKRVSPGGLYKTLITKHRVGVKLNIIK